MDPYQPRRNRACGRVRAVALALLGLWAVAVPAVEPPPVTDPELKACLERTLPRHSMTQRLSIQVFDATGSVTDSRARFYWQRGADARSRFLVRISSPPARAGIGLLAVQGDGAEPDIYLYLPELRQTRRVTGRTFSGSMLGTDFSYEDYAQFHGITVANATRRLADVTFADRPSYVVEVIPKEEHSAYSRIVTYIDKSQCLPLRTEFFGRDGGLRKQLDVDQASIQQQDDRYIPQHVVMHDHAQDTRTELVIDEVSLDDELRESLFAPSSLATGR